MLFLNRRVNQCITIGNVRVMVVALPHDHGRGQVVQLGIEAPRHIPIRRAELPQDKPHKDWIDEL